MKILQVIHSLSYGGAEKLACDLSLEMKGAGHQACVACLDDEGPLTETLAVHDIPFSCLKRKPGLNISLALKLARLYEREKIDVIHAHQYTPFFYSAIGKILSKRKMALIFTEHGRHQPDRLSLKRALFNRCVLSRVNAITGVSLFSKKSLGKYEFIPESRIEVIYNGVKDSNISEGSAFRKALGIEDDELVVGCIGRFHPVKGQETLTRAFAEVVQAYEPVRLLYVGSGFLEDANRRLTDELGIASHVLFLGETKKPLEYLACMDIVVVPSLSEACSLTLLEAMMAHRAIVATNVGGNPEILVDGESGILVPSLDIFEMAKAILELLKAPSKRSEMGEMAYQRACQNFSYRRMISSYEKLYTRCFQNTVEKKC